MTGKKLARRASRGAQGGVVHGAGPERERGPGSVTFNGADTVATFTPSTALQRRVHLLQIFGFSNTTYNATNY